MPNGVWRELRGPCDMPQRPVSGCSTFPEVSGRSRACCSQSHGFALDNQPTLGNRIITGSLESRHLPVADVCCLNKIVQCQFIANTATFVIHDHIQQLSSYWLCRVCFRACFASPLLNIFSHEQRLMVAIETGQTFPLLARGSVNGGSPGAAALVAAALVTQLPSVPWPAGRRSSCWP
jgi:hypothetical protein